MINSIYSTKEVLEKKFGKNLGFDESKETMAGPGENLDAEPMQSNPNDPMNFRGKKPLGTYLNAGLEAAGSIISTANTTNQTFADDNASLLNNVATGAKLGSTVGGPYGAIAGAAIGGIYSVIDSKNDRKRKTRENNKRVNAELAQTKENRMIQQRIEDGEATNGRLQAVYKSQLGIIS